jgi:hypothetical protein
MTWLEMVALIVSACGMLGSSCAMAICLAHQHRLGVLEGSIDAVRSLSNLRRQMRAILKDNGHPTAEELWEDDAGDSVGLHHLDRIAKHEKQMRDAGGWKLLGGGPISKMQARKELDIDE